MVFALHLSRPTLVAIMLISMAAISALNLSHPKTDQFTLEKIDLAPWPKSYWQQWPISNKSTLVAHWQQQPSEHITIAMHLDNMLQHRWQLDISQWARQLPQLLQQDAISDELQSSNRIGVAISGPIADTQIRWLLATIEHELHKRQAEHKDIPAPEVQIPAAQQLSQCINQLGNMRQTDIAVANQHNPIAAGMAPAHSPQTSKMTQEVVWTTAGWNQRRQQLARHLRYRWLEPTQQFDIQAELAYHRLAPNWIDKLYLELAGLSPVALQTWLNCQLSS